MLKTRGYLHIKDWNNVKQRSLTAINSAAETYINDDLDLGLTTSLPLSRPSSPEVASSVALDSTPWPLEETVGPSPPVCHICKEQISLPAWYCIDCDYGTWICPQCDQKVDQLAAWASQEHYRDQVKRASESSNHHMYHLLIKVTKAIKNDPHKQTTASTGGPTTTQSGDFTRQHMEQLMDAKLEEQYTKFKEQMDKLEQRMSNMMAEQMARLTEMLQPRIN
uniref:B box-type domain-containing protein n=1 Tax=Mycena chlorophos TaxID=658473 RepID=A0ABQ0L6N4_MYCCL|nr:predicted protein [Mycena chlorophos]